jgi:hypothetical protein
MPSRLSCLPPAALLMAALAGCGRADARSAADAPLPAGAEVVRNGESGAWGDGRGWRLSEDLRIGGGANGEGPDVFGRIIAVDADLLGRVWVADVLASEIRVFGADGRHVRTVGRKGEGPGEFVQISGMAFAPDGRLWVLDGGASRFTVLDTAGAVAATHARHGGGALTPWPGGFDREGRLYDPLLVATPDGAVSQAVVRYTAAFTPLDTLRIPPFEGEYFERGRDRVNVPFTGLPFWTRDAAGDLWMGVTDRYRLFRTTMAGDTVRVVEKAQAPVPVTDEDLEWMLQVYDDFVRRGGRVDRSRIPDAKPPVYGAFPGDDGTLWVVPARGLRDPMVFDVFDPAGRYLGRVRPNAEVALTPAPVIRRGHLYGVVRDHEGVESVTRLRIEKPG